MRQAIAIAHRFGDETKRLQRGFPGGPAAAYARGMREAGDGKPVPVGQNLVVAAGCGRCYAG